MKEVSEAVTYSVDCFLSLFSLANGNKINLQEICKSEMIECNQTRAAYLNKISQGSESAFKSFVNCLEMNNSKEALVELYSLIFEERVKFDRLGKTLGYTVPESRASLCVILIYKHILMYDFLLKTRVEELSKVTIKKAKLEKSGG